jgi:hypothetical protein
MINIIVHYLKLQNIMALKIIVIIIMICVLKQASVDVEGVEYKMDMRV